MKNRIQVTEGRMNGTGLMTRKILFSMLVFVAAVKDRVLLLP